MSWSYVRSYKVSTTFQTDIKQ